LNIDLEIVKWVDSAVHREKVSANCIADWNTEINRISLRRKLWNELDGTIQIENPGLHYASERRSDLGMERIRSSRYSARGRLRYLRSVVQKEGFVWRKVELTKKSKHSDRAGWQFGYRNKWAQVQLLSNEIPLSIFYRCVKNYFLRINKIISFQWKIIMYNIWTFKFTLYWLISAFMIVRNRNTCIPRMYIYTCNEEERGTFSFFWQQWQIRSGV